MAPRSLPGGSQEEPASPSRESRTSRWPSSRRRRRAGFKVAFPGDPNPPRMRAAHPAHNWGPGVYAISPIYPSPCDSNDKRTFGCCEGPQASKLTARLPFEMEVHRLPYLVPNRSSVWECRRNEVETLLGQWESDWVSGDPGPACSRRPRGNANVGFADRQRILRLGRMIQQCPRGLEVDGSRCGLEDRRDVRTDTRGMCQNLLRVRREEPRRNMR